MTGFKNFILRGNLVELAVAFVMAAAFATVVTATVNIILSIVGKIGGRPDFSAIAPGGIPIGAWLTALVSFLILAAVVYFLIVVPYRAYEARLGNTVFGPAAPTQTCPECQSDDLPVKATRCKYCTAELRPSSEGPGA